MKIIVDAHGGDNSPLEVLKGSALAVAEYGIEVVLCGKEQELRQLMAKESISDKGMIFAGAGQVMPVEADPTSVVKEYADSSITVGLKLLAEGGGDAFVSAGSTGAVTVGSSLIVKRIKGIKRAAIAVVMPTTDGQYMLIDGGANAECRPEMLCQFGIMGSAYMGKMFGLASPRVGMVNIGAEETKGLELQIEANKLLKEAPVNFIGNVEGRDLPLGGCDVAVADGFTGNVILKLTEGMGKMMSVELKKILLGSTLSKVAALIVKKNVMNFRKRMDYTEYGGSPLLGIAKPVVKAHGSSNAHAIKNAIRQAKEMVEHQVIAQVEQALAQIKAAEKDQ
ncbi:MAG: phosphate acyltransferase PlsX [Oscillospiraceae bacterium]